MWVIVGLSGGMLVLNVWAEVEDSVEDKASHNYQETFWVDLPLQGEGVQIRDVIVFSKTEEEHLKHLHVVFNHFWEHNLRLKPTKCKFFWDEINYLVHHVSKEGMWLSKENLKTVAKFAQPKLTWKSEPSLEPQDYIFRYRWECSLTRSLEKTYQIVASNLELARKKRQTKVPAPDRRLREGDSAFLRDPAADAWDPRNTSDYRIVSFPRKT